MTLVFEDYTPIYVGDTLKPFAPTFQDIDPVTGQLVPVDLSGATITMKMQNEFGTVQVCSGLWTIDYAALGQAHYTWQAADVAVPGTWQLYVTITIGGKPVHADQKALVILPAP